MKKLLLLPLLLFAASTLLAQPSKNVLDTMQIVTYYKNGKINEKYVRNASGEKDGDYVRYSRYGKTYITGHYVDGKPAGTWEYFSADTNGTLVEKLDFNTHKELFLDSMRVPEMICGPRYFGGALLKNEYVSQRIKSDFTTEERAKYKGQTFVVSFTIDSVTYKPVLIDVSDTTLPADVRAKMVKIVSDMPAWLPPVCKSKNDVWRFSVNITM